VRTTVTLQDACRAIRAAELGGLVWKAGIWLIPTALIIKVPGAPVTVLRLVGDLGLVSFVGAVCFGCVGFSLRFGCVRWPIIESISENAFGIYFFHFLFVLWTQFALLALPLPAIIKGVSVLIVSLLLSWLTSIAAWRMLMLTRPLLGPAWLRTSA
jgi:hypothetical protein